jgi:L-amino acid N-acyltransferase YncA
MSISETIEIRPAEPRDLPAITAIYEHAVRFGTASYELEPPSEEEMMRRYHSVTAASYPYLVAELSRGVAGYAYAGPFRTRPAYRFIVENSVYVAPHAQKRGIGRALMRKLIAEVERLGFRQIVAVIGDGHADSPSVRLHEALGFRHSGCLKGSGFKHGRWLDTVFMQLPLNGGDKALPDPHSLPERLFLGKTESD